MENTLAANASSFKAGIVSEQGFAALMDAETYDNVSSVSAGSKHIKVLWDCLYAGKQLSLFRPDGEVIDTIHADELERWCRTNFPSCFSYYKKRC